MTGSLDMERGEGVPRFASPAEEIAFLREEIRRREETLERFAERSGEENPAASEQSAESLGRDRIVNEEVDRYKRIPREDALAREYQMPPEEAGEIVLRLSPETHDRKMEELLGVLVERGIMNTLSVVEEMGNPHLEDDFHRVLVQYLKAMDKEKKKGSGGGVDVFVHFKRFSPTFNPEAQHYSPALPAFYFPFAVPKESAIFWSLGSKCVMWKR